MPLLTRQLEQNLETSATPSTRKRRDQRRSSSLAIDIGMTRIATGKRQDLAVDAMLRMKILGTGGKRGNGVGAGVRIGAVGAIGKAGVKVREIVPEAGIVTGRIIGQRALGIGIQIGVVTTGQIAGMIAMVVGIAIIRRVLATATLADMDPDVHMTAAGVLIGRKADVKNPRRKRRRVGLFAGIGTLSERQTTLQSAQERQHTGTRKRTNLEHGSLMSRVIRTFFGTEDLIHLPHPSSSVLEVRNLFSVSLRIDDAFLSRWTIF